MGGWAPHPYINLKMNDREGVYWVLKKFYDSSPTEEKPEKKFVKSLCEDKKYKKGESRLERAGKKQRVYSIIHRLNVLNLSVLAEEARKEEIKVEELESIIADLKSRGLIYEPEPGVVGCAGD